MQIKKVFLKFNRTSGAAKICFDQWIKIFHGYDLTIISDTDDVTLSKLRKNFDVINTDYSLTNSFLNCFENDKWIRAGAANLTAYKNAVHEDYFWLIDADDTIFYASNLEIIQQKIKDAEKYCIEKNLDGFSLDFYRELVNDHWSFGVCILKSSIDLEKLKLVEPEQVKTDSIRLNLDGAFDFLRRNSIFNLQSFIFEDTFFHHHVGEWKHLSLGVYHWKNGFIWDKIKLSEEIVIF